MPQVKIDASELVIFEGIAKNGRNAGKPYAFVKIDRRLSNSQTFVEAVKNAGARVIGKSADQPDSQSFSIEK